MLATRAGIYMPAWMAIKAGHLQYASTMTTTTRVLSLSVAFCKHTETDVQGLKQEHKLFNQNMAAQSRYNSDQI